MDITYVKAVFGSLRKTRTKAIFRDDHDLILQLVGVKGLPVHFQAHFSNTEYGTAVVMMGSDGEVSIPNTLLATGLPVYCWILVEQGISGAVRYSVQIPVRQKARPDGTVTPEQADIISQAISALNDAGTAAQEAADSAAQNAEYVAGVKDDLYEAIDRVEVLEEAKETTLEAAGNAEAWAVGNRDGSAVPSTDPTYHNNSKYYAEQAAESARTLTIDSTLTQAGQAADAKKTGDAIDGLSEALEAEEERAKSEEARIEALFTQPVEEAVSNWLDEHPEATTTVQDASLTYAKLVTGTLGYVIPEMFGAVGDGVTDDSVAIQNAINFGEKVVFVSDYYCASSITVGGFLDGNFKTLICDSIIRVRQGNTRIINLIIDNPESQSMRHTFEIMHADNAILENVTILNSQGDGLYVNDSHVVATNLRIEHAKRNGISHISGYLSVDNFYIGEVEGYSPQMGVDIEPNLAGEVPITKLQHGQIECTKNISLSVSESIRTGYIFLNDIILNSMNISCVFDGKIVTKNIYIKNSQDMDSPLRVMLYKERDTGITQPIPFFDIECFFKSSNPPQWYFFVYGHSSPFNGKLSCYFDQNVVSKTQSGKYGLFRNFSSDTELENTIFYETNFPNSIYNYGNRGTIIEK